MWILTRFGTVELPRYNLGHDAGTAPSLQAMVRGPGGALVDAIGTGRAPLELPYELAYPGFYVESSPQALVTAVRALDSQRGRRDRLYRRWSVDRSINWAWARFGRNGKPFASNQIVHQKVEPVFTIQSQWYGTQHGPWLAGYQTLLDAGVRWVDDSTFALAAGYQAVAVTNAGNARNDAAIMTFTAGTAEITSLTVAVGGGVDWTFSGVIPAGVALVVDSGARSVLLDGADAYDDFHPGAGQTIEGWLRLFQAQATSIGVTVAGGGTGSTLSVAFAETWE